MGAIADAPATVNASLSARMNLFLYTTQPGRERFAISGQWFYIRILNSRLAEASVSGFKDWLSGLNSLGTPMCLVYKLATPITESIDPDAIPALSGTNNVHTNAGGETTVIGRIGAKGMMDKLMTMQQITALQALNDAG